MIDLNEILDQLNDFRLFSTLAVHVEHHQEIDVRGFGNLLKGIQEHLQKQGPISKEDLIYLFVEQTQEEINDPFAYMQCVIYTSGALIDGGVLKAYIPPENQEKQEPYLIGGTRLEGLIGHYEKVEKLIPPGEKIRGAAA